ncbi:MAG: NAD-dependent epimerase/dehydratase family protein [Pirellulaceae bacterium]|nr:NAD-dependent epimerase/dehydratase family protein [Pirellulaceae bacterium]
MVIFVTGATGLLGNSIVRQLLSQGYAVRALCRQETTRRGLEGLDVQIVDGDLRDSQQLARGIKGCQAAIHSAAMIHIGWSRLAQSRQVNVEGTRRIVEACVAQDVKLLHISTVDTLPAAISLEQPIDETATGGVPKVPCNYVVSKREAEDVVRCAISEQGLRACILHPGFMLGPYDWKPSSGRLLLSVAKAPVALATAGGCSLCDARDVAAGIVQAIDRAADGQHYILAGENLTYRDLWARILQIAGRPRRVYWPYRAMTVAGWMCDALYRCLPLREGDINGASIAMGQLNHYYSSAKAQQELGYNCRPSQQTLEDAWRWLNQHHGRST